VEIDDVFYESLKHADRMTKYSHTTIKKRCLSDDFPNYKIIPFRVTYTKKKCVVCGKAKLLKQFCKNTRNKDKLSSKCKQCDSKSAKEWEKNNPGYKNANSKEWYKNNTEHARIYNKKRYEKNAESIKNSKKLPEVKNKNNKRQREKRKNDPAHRLNKNMGKAIWASLKNQKNGAHWEDLVEYTCSELITHLESLFTEGMNWDNYGHGKYKWNLDHVIAITKFNIASAECQAFKDCWALKNLQPLWQTRNFEKGDKPMEVKYLIKPF